MTLAELLAKYPELYAQVFALGRDEERERVQAHATMAVASGDSELGLKHIADGSAFGPAVQAEYAAAHMKVTTRAALTDDDKDAPKGDGGDAGKTADGPTQDQIFSAAFDEIDEGLDIKASA